MDNRLDSPLIGGGKGSPLYSASGILVTPVTSSDCSGLAELRPDGTEKGSREADGTGADKEASGALLLLSATSDDLMSLSGDMDSMIFREALALADQFANAKDDDQDEPGAMAASWQRLSADAGHMAHMLASGAQSSATPPPPESAPPGRTPAQQRTRSRPEPPVVEAPCYRMSEPPPPAELRRYRFSESPTGELERAARAASPAYAALCEKASAELRQLELQTQEEYENLQFEALERSVSTASGPRRPPQLTPWDVARPDSGTFRVNKSRRGTYRASPAQPDVPAAAAPPQCERPEQAGSRLLAGATETPARQQRHRLSGPAGRNHTFGRDARMGTTFDTEAPLDRTFDANTALDRTFGTNALLDRTFDSEAPLDRTFDTEGPLNSTFVANVLGLDRTFDADARPDCTFGSEVLADLDLVDGSPWCSTGASRRLSQLAGGGVSALNQTFDAGVPTAPVSGVTEQPGSMADRRVTINSTFDGPPPGHRPGDADGVRSTSANPTVDRDARPNRTLDRDASVSRTVDMDPPVNRTVDRNPPVNRTVDRNPPVNRTVDRNVLPCHSGNARDMLNRTANRSASLDRTLDQDMAASEPVGGGAAARPRGASEPLSGAAAGPGGGAAARPRGASEPLSGAAAGRAVTGGVVTDRAPAAPEPCRFDRHGRTPAALQQISSGALEEFDEPPVKLSEYPPGCGDSPSSCRGYRPGSRELTAWCLDPRPGSQRPVADERTSDQRSPELVSAGGRVLRRTAGPVTSTPRRSVSSGSTAGLTPISAGRLPTPPAAPASLTAGPPPAALFRDPAVPPAAGRNGLVRLTAQEAGLAPRANGLVRPMGGLVRPATVAQTEPARAAQPRPADVAHDSALVRPSRLPAPRATAAPSGLRPPAARTLRAPAASGLRPPAASGLGRPTRAALQRTPPAPLQAAAADDVSRVSRTLACRDGSEPAFGPSVTAVRRSGLAAPRASGLRAPATGRGCSSVPTGRGSRLLAPAASRLAGGPAPPAASRLAGGPAPPAASRLAGGPAPPAASRLAGGPAPPAASRLAGGLAPPAASRLAGGLAGGAGRSLRAPGTFRRP